MDIYIVRKCEYVYKTKFTYTFGSTLNIRRRRTWNYYNVFVIVRVRGIFYHISCHH